MSQQPEQDGVPVVDGWLPDWAPLPAGFVVSDPQALARALEAVRRQVCGYNSGGPCDCKYGRTETTQVGWTEQTGCPELRCVIEALIRGSARGGVDQ